MSANDDLRADPYPCNVVAAVQDIGLRVGNRPADWKAFLLRVCRLHRMQQRPNGGFRRPISVEQTPSPAPLSHHVRTAGLACRHDHLKRRQVLRR